MFGRTLPHRLRSWQRNPRTAQAALLALVMAVMLPLPVSAALQEYTVLTSVQDISEQKAQDKALDYARKRAVYLSVRKLNVKDPGATAERIPPKDMAQIVRGATVLQSSRKGDQTYAKISVSIEDTALRKLLDIKNTDAAPDIKAVRQVLVLPILVTPDKTYVWGKENILRAPLSIELMRQSHGTVILPGGDFADLRLIDAENMAAVTATEMKPMFERYGADEIILAITKPSAKDTPDPTTVLLRRLSGLNPRSETFALPPDKPEDTVEDRLAQAARAIATSATEIATSTAAREHARLDAARQIHVRLAYGIPKELATLETTIRSAPRVLLLELPTIALHDITGTIYIDGDPKDVREYLGKHGVVVRGKDTDWIVSTR